MNENHQPETRVARVIDYILNHPDQDLSRHALSEVAHYSAEHLPKLFKQLVGETPKQYSLRLRLETAFHHLVIHPNKTVQDVAFDCGFTAPSTFSRAIRNYFGHSPEQIRLLPHAQQMRLLHKTAPSPSFSPGTGKPLPPPDICVVREPTITGIHMLAPFHDPDMITKAFQTLYQAAPCAHRFYGILTPHLRNTYRAFIPFATNATSQIKGGTYARFTVMGDLRTANKAAHYFYRRWLPGSGYKVAGIAGFETFDQNPAFVPYLQLRRHIHIPIEPAH